MAGYTDSAFRLLCREYGADVVMSELVSADAIAYASAHMKVEKVKIDILGEGELLFNRVVSTKNQPTAELLGFFERERPFVIQLFGKHPDKFALAAKWVTENLKPDGIDINMGCPARKVVNSDHGAALLKNPDLAVEIVKAVRENTTLPVSVKTRLGWDNDDSILEFAPKLKEAGIDSIMVHGRTYKDGFKNSARWENIFKLKEMFGDKLIVIGNGDVNKISNDEFLISHSSQSVRALPSESKTNQILNTYSKISKFIFKCPSSQLPTPNSQLPTLDGIAVGRATFGKPWLFSSDEIDREELKKLILRHATLSFATKGEKGMIEFRKHLLCYLKGFEGAKEMRKSAVTIQCLDDVKSVLKAL
jgi:tRNA-dihydrouridine synthase